MLVATLCTSLKQVGENLQEDVMVECGIACCYCINE